jgi:heme/copper-type cytochrome/quinol oxidase subunit 2
MAFALRIGFFLAVSLIARVGLSRWGAYRRRSGSGNQWQEFKSRLPTWVKQVELVFQIVFLLTIFFGLVFGVSALHVALHRNSAKPAGISEGLIVLSSLFGALVPAMLLANLLSWSIPAMRNANLVALEGLQNTSFSSANIGLMKLGAVLIPVCTIAAAIAVYDPWGH